MPHVIAHVHGCEHRQQEKSNPQLVPTFENFRVRPHQHRKRFAVAKFVLTPVFEPLENRVKLMFRMFLQVTENRDIPCVSDLLGQIGRVEDEFGLKIRVLLGLGQKREIHRHVEIFQGMIDKPRMTTFIPAHHAKKLAHVWVLHAFLDFRVQNASGKLRRHRAHQKLDELMAQFRIHARKIRVKLCIALEMVLVGIPSKLGHQFIPHGANRCDIKLVHRGKVRGVESGTQCRILLGYNRTFVQLAFARHFSRARADRQAGLRWIHEVSPRSRRHTDPETQIVQPAWSTRAAPGPRAPHLPAK